MNLISILEENARLFSKSAAVIDGSNDQIITYQELWQKVDAVAFSLRTIGIGPGDRVALYLHNGAEYIIAYFAILKLGAIAVPFNVLFKNFEIKRILESSRAKAILGASREIEQELNPIRHELPYLLTTIGVGQHDGKSTDLRFEDWLEGIEGKLEGLQEKDLKKNLVPLALLADDQPAAIHYTSGTTGQMKGVVLTHHNISSNAKINGHYLLGLNDQDRVLGLSPFSHVYFFQVVLGPLTVGACAVTLPRSSPKLALEAIEKYRITHLSTVPTMFRYLLQQYRENTYDVSSWRVAGSAAVNINSDLVKEVQDTFSVEIFDTYGCTEVSSTITYTRVRHYIPGSVGLPAHGYEVKLIGDLEKEVGVGEIGELAVKGPGVFSCYWEMPEKTRESFTLDGYFKSGDLARQDQDGNIYIIGRKNDVVVSGGYKIYPWEVEEHLLSHPDIIDAVVIPKGDKDLGEVPIAFIILKQDSTLDPNEIIEFCEKNLAKYKCPRAIEFRVAFPRSTTGKILKRLLQEELDELSSCR